MMDFLDNTMIVTPKFNRDEELGFEAPKTTEEFYGIVNNAPENILYEFGFRKWSSMNEIIEENLSKPERKMVKIPAINLTDNPANDFLEIEVGRNTKTPTERLEKDEMIWLFPAEWYKVIPDGLIQFAIPPQLKE